MMRRTIGCLLWTSSPHRVLSCWETCALPGNLCAERFTTSGKHEPPAFVLDTSANFFMKDVTLQQLAEVHPELDEFVAKSHRESLAQRVQQILDDHTLRDQGERLDACQITSLQHVPEAELDKIIHDCKLGTFSSRDEAMKQIHQLVLRSSRALKQAAADQMTSEAPPSTPSSSSSSPTLDAMFQTELRLRLAREQARSRLKTVVSSQPRGMPGMSPASAVDPWAPLPGVKEARTSVRAQVSRLLRKLGYINKDPSILSSVKLLRLEHLAEILEDCGLPAFGKHSELAERVFALMEDPEAIPDPSKAYAVPPGLQQAVKAMSCATPVARPDGPKPGEGHNTTLGHESAASTDAPAAPLRQESAEPMDTPTCGLQGSESTISISTSYTTHSPIPGIPTSTLGHNVDSEDGITGRVTAAEATPLKTNSNLDGFDDVCIETGGPQLFRWDVIGDAHNAAVIDSSTLQTLDLPSAVPPTSSPKTVDSSAMNLHLSTRFEDSLPVAAYNSTPISGSTSIHSEDRYSLPDQQACVASSHIHVEAAHISLPSGELSCAPPSHDGAQVGQQTLSPTSASPSVPASVGALGQNTSSSHAAFDSQFPEELTSGQAPASDQLPHRNASIRKPSAAAVAANATTAEVSDHGLLSGASSSLRAFGQPPPAGVDQREIVLWRQEQRRLIGSTVEDPDLLSHWLIKAKAQDLCVIDLRNRAGYTDWMIIGTGLSQQHVAACVKAVRYQIGEKLKGLGEEVLAQLGLHTPDVVGPPVSDWVALHMGSCVVHMFTHRARRFYDLEGLWGTEGTVKWIDTGEGLMTLDTITAVDEGREQRQLKPGVWELDTLNLRPEASESSIEDRVAGGGPDIVRPLGRRRVPPLPRNQ